MIRMIRLSAVAVVLSTSLLAMAQQRTVTTYVTGSATATEPDQQQATNEAQQQATYNANNVCIGTVTNTSITSSNCIHLGNDDQGTGTYTCMATVRATCEIPYRGR